MANFGLPVLCTRIGRRFLSTDGKPSPTMSRERRRALKFGLMTRAKLRKDPVRLVKVKEKAGLQDERVTEKAVKASHGGGTSSRKSTRRLREEAITRHAARERARISHSVAQEKIRALKNRSIAVAIHDRQKRKEPLRILFCGSDEFSCASLKALVELQKRAPSLIESVDVMIRPGKPSGRSMKVVREVPIKQVAQVLGLPVHERDTFTGWEPPLINGKPINLIIAVSFGLFVPPRILKGAYFGGINVHPSLLPNLRGPAPIHHTILTKQAYTGVTLQTLHPEKFDHGLILSRTPQSDLVTVSDTMKYDDLHKKLRVLGGDLLAGSLARKIYIPPLRGLFAYPVPKGKLEHASKITPADRKMDFTQSDRFWYQYRALGRLWADLCVDDSTTRRVVFEDFEKFEYYTPGAKLGADENSNAFSRPLLAKDTNIEFANAAEPAPNGFRVLVSPAADGEKESIFYTEHGDAVLLALPGNSGDPVILRVKNITIAGGSAKPAAKALRSLQKSGKWIIEKPDERKPFSAQEYRRSPLALWGSSVNGFITVSASEEKRRFLANLLITSKEQNKEMSKPEEEMGLYRPPSSTER